MNESLLIGQDEINGQIGAMKHSGKKNLQSTQDSEGETIAKPKRKKRKLPTGFYRPKYACKKCDSCNTKSTCKNKLEQQVIWYRKSFRGIRRAASTGCTNIRNAKEVASRLRDMWERYSVGLKTTGAVTIEDGLKEFRLYLRTQKGSESYHDTVIDLINEVFQHSSPRLVADLSETTLAAWKPDANRRNLSKSSRNKRISALRRIGVWLLKKGHLDIDPFALLVLHDEEKDRRRRRAMWPWEVDHFLRTVRTRRLKCEREYRKHVDLSTDLAIRFRREGRVRALVYNTISQTGLRRKEVTKVRVKDVDFESNVIWIPAHIAKSQREQHVTMPKPLTRRLAAYIRTLGDVDPASVLFPSTNKIKLGGARAPKTAVPTITTFDKDLRAAGIAKQDARGRTLDLHALRTTYITHLRLADVPLDVAKRMARHSDIRLTEDVYTDFDKLGDAERNAAEALGALRRRAR